MAKTAQDWLKHVESATKKIADESKRTDDSWRNVGKSVDQVTKNFDKGFLRSVTMFTGTHGLVQSIGKTLGGILTGNAGFLREIGERIVKLEKDQKAARSFAEGRRISEALDREKKYLKAVEVMTGEVGNVINSKWAAAAGLFAAEMKIAFKYSQEINEQLKQTSAAYSNRARLAREIAQIQAVTGNEMADMAKGGAALAQYGFDLRDGFKETLTTMVKMEEGLGVSYDTSAQLATLTRRIGGNFKDIADSVARIKADTALSADEATRFATQISKAVMMLKPGSGTLVSQTTDYINRVAGALKELTGSGQGFVDMLASFTTEAGMMGAATLGATPDFLASPEKTKQVTENFVKYVNRQLSGTSGFQRMATIQLLAEQFNTSADVIANADEMLKKYNETQKNRTGLEEEWRKQTSELNKSLSKMYNSLAAIIQQTMIPIIRKLNPILETATTWLQKFSQSGAALYAGVGLLTVSAIGATVAVYKLTAALARFALTSGVLNNVTSLLPGKLGALKTGFISLFDISKSPILARATGWLGTGRVGGAVTSAIMGTSTKLTSMATSVTTWLPRIASFISRLAGPLGLVALAAAGGWAVGRMIDKGLKKMGVDLSELVRSTKPDQFRSAMLSLGRGSMTREDMLRQVGAMAGSGADAEAIQAYIMRNINKLRGMHVTDASGREVQNAAWRAKIVEGILGDVGGEITRQRARLGYTTLTTQSSEDKARDERMIHIFKDIAMNTAFTGKVTDQVERRTRLIEETSKRERDEIEAEERLRRQRMEDIQDAMRRAGASGWGPKF